MQKNSKEQWETYKEQELEKAVPLLCDLGFEIDDTQPHMSGERYLMQAVTTASGKKLILLGKRTSDGKRVVVKATSDQNGAKELERERECRSVLQRINFAYDTFFSPKEILFTEKNGMTISIQEFIEQEKTFLERPLKEQFRFALAAFKAQEGAHATTYGHIRLIAKTFDTKNAGAYIKTFGGFRENITAVFPENTALQSILKKAEALLSKNEKTVEQYCGFLTHIDFVPHNFRIRDGVMYLLDHSSLRFGNKHEGWARFLNFMALYHPELEQALLQYVRDNRASEEARSLYLMRAYRLGEIIWYYANTLSQSSGDVYTLNSARVVFWGRVLEATLAGVRVPTNVIETYKQTRDSLRSDEENKRQEGLH